MEESIYKQMDVLNPKELLFLKESISNASSYLSEYIKKQESELERIEKEEFNQLYELFLGSKEERIDSIQKALIKNRENLQLVSSIENKFKKFDGII